jgi:hypothetical protein
VPKAAPEVRVKTYTNRKGVTYVTATFSVDAAKKLMAGSDSVFDEMIAGMTEVPELAERRKRVRKVRTKAKAKAEA